MPEKRRKAFSRTTDEAQKSILAMQPTAGETIGQHKSHTENKKEEKISFYLTIEQADKLDDLAYEHKKRTGRRINRNDIVRYLIDQCSLDSLKEI